MQRCEHLADGIVGVRYPLPGGILAELCPECLAELQQRLEERIRAATPIEEYAREREESMQQCAFSKRKQVREKGGRLVKRDVPVCGLAAAEGSKFCPRHAFLAAIEKTDEQHREDMATEAVEAGVNKRLPPTRAGLIAGGYQYTGNGNCSRCNAPIEWWRTPKGKAAPFEPMPFEASFSRTHFADCPGAAQFRKAS